MYLVNGDGVRLPGLSVAVKDPKFGLSLNALVLIVVLEGSQIVQTHAPWTVHPR
jgi:hypothetical protein